MKAVLTSLVDERELLGPMLFEQLLDGDSSVAQSYKVRIGIKLLRSELPEYVTGFAFLPQTSENIESKLPVFFPHIDFKFVKGILMREGYTYGDTDLRLGHPILEQWNYEALH